MISKILARAKNSYPVIFLVLALIAFYFIGANAAHSFKVFTHFNGIWVLDSAQVARNTLHGHFFDTKYILPAGYSFFPTVIDHPDFIRYPLPVLIYTLLFAIFSPGATSIKVLNAILFVANGVLIYLFALKILRFGNQQLEFRQTKIHSFIAVFTALAASVFEFYYYQMALFDFYEIMAVTMLLITMNVVIEKKIQPLVLGLIFGLLYLTKPTFSLFIFIFCLYYLMDQKTFKTWFLGGLFCVLGFLIIVSPFIVRSLIITGEPMFALQHKIDSIKEVVYSHDALYRTFSRPPSLMETVVNNQTSYWQRWRMRVIVVAKILLQPANLFIWPGLLLFFAFLKKTRAFFLSFLGFFALHVAAVAIYLLPNETMRVYTPLIELLYIFAFLGLFVAVSWLIQNISRITYQNIIFGCIAIVICVSGVLMVRNGALSDRLTDTKDDFPQQMIERVHEISPTCLYSNSGAKSAWFLDLPVVYSPLKLDEILTKGPRECNYFLLSGEDDDAASFLKRHGMLLYTADTYKLYEINDLK
ncbi:MAG: hypothetical protein VB013_09565 [Anaerolineaceae bacterium]|nr:hypothetical protein [Anaerolineaceae bacterium]